VRSSNDASMLVFAILHPLQLACNGHWPIVFPISALTSFGDSAESMFTLMRRGFLLLSLELLFSGVAPQFFFSRSTQFLARFDRCGGGSYAPPQLFRPLPLPTRRHVRRIPHATAIFHCSDGERLRRTEFCSARKVNPQRIIPKQVSVLIERSVFHPSVVWINTRDVLCAWKKAETKPLRLGYLVSTVGHQEIA